MNLIDDFINAISNQNYYDGKQVKEMLKIAKESFNDEIKYRDEMIKILNESIEKHKNIIEEYMYKTDGNIQRLLISRNNMKDKDNKYFN